jgi:hypothetical protein
MLWIFLAIENVVLILLIYFLTKTFGFSKKERNKMYVCNELKKMDHILKDITVIMDDKNA